MKRQAQMIIVCEDSQHEAFARRLFDKVGWHKRKVRVVKAPKARGSGSQFVLTRFVQEPIVYRANRHRVDIRLVIIIDGDAKGTDEIRSGLDQLCVAAGVDPRKDDEKVAIFIPTWRIETWLHYLRGNEVDEMKKDYPRLLHAKECRDQVDVLHKMCQKQTLTQPAPNSLVEACVEYRTRLF